MSWLIYQIDVVKRYLRNFGPVISYIRIKAERKKGFIKKGDAAFIQIWLPCLFAYNVFNPLATSVFHHIETSQLIWRAKRYILVFNGLKDINKDTRATSLTLSTCLYCWFWTYLVNLILLLLLLKLLKQIINYKLNY